ncbi:MAG TPA: HEPN domain-containing protein [Tepidisphaeraceae bacterium]|jgi:hypothetical protein|nr:HEPN domain-containing protein [Tepidisphaeraceae bacterium]
MASASKASFEKNCRDVSRLIEIHGELTGKKAGRRAGVEVINKSAVALTSAAWEAYVEDICQEAAGHLSANLADPTRLPDDLKKVLSKRVLESKHDFAAMGLAADGWKKILTDHVKELTEGRKGGLNTPKSAEVRDLFLKALGMSDITTTWNWTNVDKNKACTDLDNYITLRGAIVHRVKADTAVTKKDAGDFLGHITKLVEKTDAAVNAHLTALTARSLF